jgi:hypothetical protein
VIDQALPYHGQLLIPFDSFLRKLPHCVASQQRLEFDAIVMASDITSLAYNQLRSFAIEVGPSSDAISELNIPMAISACWTIVDQLHAIRQLLNFQAKAIEDIGPKTKQLLNNLSVATAIRNKMDHLKDNIGNLSKSKFPQSPLFGSVSYFYASNIDDSRGFAITAYSAALLGQQRVPIVNPIERPFVLPVGLFEFSAFGETLKVEPLLKELMEYFEIMISDIEKQVSSAAIAHAEENELSLDELMASARGTFSFVAEFGPPPSGDD